MKSNARTTIILAAIVGAFGVGIGAFGAHAFKSVLVENNRLDTFELASRYHFYHTLVLLASGILMLHFQSRVLWWATLFLLTGLILFSGSLYWLSFTNHTAVAMITPIGGVLMIVGWLTLAYAVLKSKPG